MIYNNKKLMTEDRLIELKLIQKLLFTIKDNEQ